MTPAGAKPPGAKRARNADGTLIGEVLRLTRAGCTVPFIAGHLGISNDSVRAKLTLLRRQGDLPMLEGRRTSLLLHLDEDDFGALVAAARREMPAGRQTAAALATRLIEVIITDDMIGAVLDGEGGE